VVSLFIESGSCEEAFCTVLPGLLLSLQISFPESCFHYEPGLSLPGSGAFLRPSVVFAYYVVFLRPFLVWSLCMMWSCTVVLPGMPRPAVVFAVNDLEFNICVKCNANHAATLSFVVHCACLSCSSVSKLLCFSAHPPGKAGDGRVSDCALATFTWLMRLMSRFAAHDRLYACLLWSPFPL